jgi:D-aminopeptidase
LHDVVGRHLNDEHVLAAIKNAQSGQCKRGAVGGGTGMQCYDFKGGIGTASRVLPERHGGYTIGVLVQANHGNREQLMIDGVPVGKEIHDLESVEGKKSKSILLIGATNAPMIPSQLQRLCKHMAFGLARTGALSSHGSGDLLLFFSTGLKVKPDAMMTEIEIFNDEWITQAHQAAMEADEAVLNALMLGGDHDRHQWQHGLCTADRKAAGDYEKYGRL